MSLDLYIDVLDANLNRYGSGPLTQITYWESTTRMDQAGQFAFEMAASDPQRVEVQPLRLVRAYAWLDGVWTEIGSGIVERIERVPSSDGPVMLRVSGADMLREYANHVTNFSFVYAGGGALNHAQAVQLVRQLLMFDDNNVVWTVTPDPTPPNDVIKFSTNKESCLFTARRVAEISGNHLYLSGFRQITYASVFATSGLRAIQPGAGMLDAETCAILRLTIADDTTEYVSRVYPRGGGNGNAEMALRYTTRAAPAGYTLDTQHGFVQNDTLHATSKCSRKVLFKDLRPISNSTVDIQAADNALFDSALVWLRRHSETYSAPLYRLSVGQCRQLLRPMQTIRVSYRDPDVGIAIEEDLKILEATIRVDDDGLRTTELAVRAADYWPESDGQVVAESVQQGQIYSSSAQPDANSYAMSFRGQLDKDANLTFPFRLGAEITQVQAVLFDFRIVPLEDTTDVSSAATTGSGGPATSGGTALTTQGGGNALTTGDSSHNHSFDIVGLSFARGYQLYFDIIAGTPTIIAVGMSGNLIYTLPYGTGHQHNGPTHTHTINSHSHAVGAHTHPAPALTVTHKPWRNPDTTLGIGTLSYRVNNDAAWWSNWIDLGGGWYRIDITSLLLDATLRPITELNTVEFKTISNYTGMLEAQLTVRCTIQAVAIA